MDELLKNCYGRLFKVGDKVRIRQDIDDLAALLEKDVNRYRRIFPDRTTPEEKINYNISLEMQSYAGKTAKVVEVFPPKNGIQLLGALYIIKINGRSLSSTWFWKHALLEKVEDEESDSSGSTRFPLKVGDTVTVRRDIAEKLDKNSYIWSTVNEQKIQSPYVTKNMVSAAGEVGKITRICSSGSEYCLIYELEFSNPTFNGFHWSINCLEEFHDYKAYVEGNNGKKKPPKQPSKKEKKTISASTADYSGYTPKSEFYCYDYLNRPSTFCKNSMENITKIEITVMSGDETGCFYGVCNGNPWQYRFDAAESRFISYDDGSYTVEGRENIEKWINWSYDPEKAIYAEYSMERMRAFKRY